MSGFLTFSFGGLSFLALSLHESLSPTLLRLPSHRHHLLRHFISLPISLLATLLPIIAALTTTATHSTTTQVTATAPLLLSFSSLSSLFLLSSLAGLLTSLRLIPPIPTHLLDLLLLTSFLHELVFLLLLIPRKDPAGIENQYLFLLAVPVLVISVSTLLSILRPNSPSPPLARAAGLALHGTWLLQMGFSFFSSAVARGCYLHSRGWGDYTIKCKGHPDYHRGRAIATLQFNCHLALIVVAGVVVYWLVGGRGHGGDGKYMAMGEIRSSATRYALVSDDEDEEILVEAGANGVGEGK